MDQDFCGLGSRTSVDQEVGLLCTRKQALLVEQEIGSLCTRKQHFCGPGCRPSLWSRELFMSTESTRDMFGFPAFTTVQNKRVYSFFFFLPSLLLFSLFLSTSGRLRVCAYITQVSNILSLIQNF